MPIISPVHRTPSLKKEEIQKNWYIVDASGKTLGRFCSFVAARLRGKHKPTFTPNQDCGDNIIIINAAKIEVKGKKAEQKQYHHHSLYPGGLTTITFDKLMEKSPEKIIMLAIKGMLPKSKLGDVMLTNLRVYADDKHELAAQKPVKLEYSEKS